MPKDGCWSTQNQYFLSQSSSTAICSGLVYVFHPRIPLPTQKSMPIFFSCRPPIIAPNCVHKLRCTIQKHRRCTFSMSYCTSAGSSINTADHPDWSCLQCTICIAKYFISYIVLQSNYEFCFCNLYKLLPSYIISSQRWKSAWDKSSLVFRSQWTPPSWLVSLQCAICIAKYFILYQYCKVIMSFASAICSNFFHRI